MHNAVRAIIAITFCFIVFFQAEAQARPKIFSLFWGPGHWESPAFVPYLEGPKIPHNAQWARDSWQPAHWERGAVTAGGMIEDLYASRIITDQYFKNDMPVLEVGPAFLRLSGQEKRRVARFIDARFGVTQNLPDGAFYLYEEKSGAPVGIFTKHGLQLQ